MEIPEIGAIVHDDRGVSAVRVDAKGHHNVLHALQLKVHEHSLAYVVVIASDRLEPDLVLVAEVLLLVPLIYAVPHFVGVLRLKEQIGQEVPVNIHIGICIGDTQRVTLDFCGLCLVEVVWRKPTAVEYPEGAHSLGVQAVQIDNHVAIEVQGHHLSSAGEERFLGALQFGSVAPVDMDLVDVLVPGL